MRFTPYIKRHQKKRSAKLPKKSFKGSIANNMLSIAFIVALMSIGGFMMIGGGFPSMQGKPGEQVVVLPPDQEQAKNNLQLYTFTGATITPKPAPPATGNACLENKFNEEPEIIFATDPPPGGVVQAGGQVRIWVDDGHGGSMAPGEKVDPTTGQIITPGDRTQSDNRGPGYYLWEPALYLTKIDSPGQKGPFSGDAENGGQPHFPQYIKGEVTYGDTGEDGQFVKGLPPIDTPPSGQRARKDHGGHIAQFVWDVNALGLPTGSGYYRVQMVVHDGDGDLAVVCTTIQI